MREVFVHEAALRMEPDADTRAPGAAITVELCGHWGHEPPCPVAPHHSRAEWVGDEVRIRTLFATEPARESEVRHRIDRALSSGRLHGPDGVTTEWQLRASRHGVIAEDETDHAQRLVRS